MDQPREPSAEEIMEAVEAAIPIVQGRMDPPELKQLPPIFREKLGEDLEDAAKMDQQQARWTVDMFYTLQDARVRAQAQNRALGQAQEPNRMLRTVQRMVANLERQLQSALFVYAQSRKPGRWMMSLPGIAHTLAAGFLAYIDITKVNSVSQIWRFAGMDPTLIWYSEHQARTIIKEVERDFDGPVVDDHGLVTPDFVVAVCRASQRKPERLLKVARFITRSEDVKLEGLTKALYTRPWNAKLKTHCWKLGECLVKVGAKPDNVYSLFMAERRALENERNANGRYAELAATILKERNYGKKTVAYGEYKQGRLPKGHLHGRAKRNGVKLFLSHLFNVLYEDHYGKAAPDPWIFEYGPEGHAHKIPPPKWPCS